MKQINYAGVFVAGLVATVVMTGLILAGPMMGMPKMEMGKMLGSVMGGSEVLGWIAHFMIGVILAGFYALFSRNRFSSNGWLDGMIYGLLPWLAAQLFVMPMMMLMHGMSYSAGLFSGSFMMAFGSFLGHLVYGAVLGLIYKEPVTFTARRRVDIAKSTT